MKKYIRIAIYATALALAVPGHADSFRTNDGKIIAAGLSRAKVIAFMGKPDSQHTETIGVSINGKEADEGSPVGGHSVEQWIYLTKGTFNQRKIVTVTLKDGTVESVQVEQPSR